MLSAPCFRTSIMKSDVEIEGNNRRRKKGKAEEKKRKCSRIG